MIFSSSNSGIVGLNPTQGMGVCMWVYSVFVLSCVQVAALRRADYMSKESYRLCKKDYETEGGGGKARAQQKGRRAVDEWMNVYSVDSMSSYIGIEAEKTQAISMLDKR
jgi:hypothetical protein